VIAFGSLGLPSEQALGASLAFGLITPVSGRTMRIHGLHTEEHALPDIDVRVSQVVSRIGLEAMLGLNFLALFTEVCFQRPSVVLTLRR